MCDDKVNADVSGERSKPRRAAADDLDGLSKSLVRFGIAINGAGVAFVFLFVIAIAANVITGDAKHLPLIGKAVRLVRPIIETFSLLFLCSAICHLLRFLAAAIDYIKARNATSNTRCRDVFEQYNVPFIFMNISLGAISVIGGIACVAYLFKTLSDMDYAKIIL